MRPRTYDDNDVLLEFKNKKNTNSHQKMEKSPSIDHYDRVGRGTETGPSPRSEVRRAALIRPKSPSTDASEPLPSHEYIVS